LGWMDGVLMLWVSYGIARRPPSCDVFSFFLAWMDSEYAAIEAPAGYRGTRGTAFVLDNIR
jgi:hypothetical protein